MRGTRAVVDQVDFTAEAGRFTCITGPNGAGKTTVLKALIGLVPFSGSVRYGNQDLIQLDRLERARTVAYVPQRSALNSALSVWDVVALGRYAHSPGLFASNRHDRDAIARALDAMDLGDLSERPYTELSGGEQRRVLLSRALATEAPIILLDEPTASLDIAHGLALFERLSELVAQGRTIISVLHNLGDVSRYAHQVVLLDNGRVVASGSPASVLTPARLETVYGVRPVPGGDMGFELSPSIAQSHS